MRMDEHVLVPVTTLKAIHRELDACQRVIWLAGGFDPAYCEEAQIQLKEIDRLLAAPAPEQLEIQNWQPITSAPRDNKRALYLARFDDSGNLLELDFNGAWEYWEESWEMPHINGWCWTSSDGIDEPTHWAFQDAPLPPTAPPAAPDVSGLVEALALLAEDSDIEAEAVFDDRYTRETFSHDICDDVAKWLRGDEVAQLIASHRKQQETNHEH